MNAFLTAWQSLLFSTIVVDNEETNTIKRYIEKTTTRVNCVETNVEQRSATFLELRPQNQERFLATLVI